MGIPRLNAQTTGWSNRDNIAFYKRIGLEGLRERATQCGLDNCPDLETLRDFFGDALLCRNRMKVLEVGAGFGRAADWILEHNRRARVELLEFTAPFVNALREKYRSETRVRIRPGSVLSVPLPHRVDLVMWLWAGFLDFTPEEKGQALRRLANVLSPTGRIVIEVPLTVGKEVAHPTAQTMVLDFNGTRWCGSVLSVEAISTLAAQVGLETQARVPYQSANGLKRLLLVFKRGLRQ